jgi:predicted Rossmann-fold nucleotide-binding protein
MRVVVCGGRHYRNAEFVFRKLNELHAEKHFRDLMQGGATGADSLARDWALTKPEIVMWVVRADWTDLSHPDAVIRVRQNGTKYDAKAGHRRNRKMLAWLPDLVVAFPGGKGTADMVEQARAADVKVIEVIEVK